MPRRTAQARSGFCSSCKNELSAREEWLWPSDVRRRFWNLTKGPLCGICAFEELEDIIRALNENDPDLKLGTRGLKTIYLFSSALLPHAPPIPDLRVSVSYFKRYRDARFKADPKGLADLLLQFEDDHPNEWHCSGWARDAVADLVLGEIGDDAATGAAKCEAAQYWLSERWKRCKQLARKMEPTEGQSCAQIAAMELNALSSRESTYAEAVKYKRFIVWLQRNAPKIRDDSGRQPGTSFAAIASAMFQNERPNAQIEPGALIDLAIAYEQVARDQEDLREPPAVSKVLLQFVASGHPHMMDGRRPISPRLVAGERAKLRDL